MPENDFSIPTMEQISINPQYTPLPSVIRFATAALSKVEPY